MATAAILDFQKFEILTVSALKGVNVRHLAKFHQNQSSGCGDILLKISSKQPKSYLLLTFRPLSSSEEAGTRSSSSGSWHD